MIRRYRPSLDLIALGAALNALVVIANAGVMPVTGAPSQGVLGGINPFVSWELASTDHHLLLLADAWALRGFSPGDLLALAGVLLALGVLGLRRLGRARRAVRRRIGLGGGA